MTCVLDSLTFVTEVSIFVVLMHSKALCTEFIQTTTLKMQNTYLFIAAYIHSLHFPVFRATRWADVGSYGPDFRNILNFPKYK
jgi:hypothetical protein